MEYLKNAKKIVIKIGSSTLTLENRKPNIERIKQLVKVVSDLKDKGKEIVIVSSGAISVGMSKLGIEERPQDISKKQALAAIGQAGLIHLYDEFFSEHNYTAAQVLITRSIIDNDTNKNNFIETISTLLTWEIIPIINENDTVSTLEIEFGDNDVLSSYVATLINADALIMLTDTDGLFDDNPQINSCANLIPVVKEINDDVISCIGSSATNRGTGGMITKIEAAKIATSNNIITYIINGNNPNNLLSLFNGNTVGTVFLPNEN